MFSGKLFHLKTKRNVTLNRHVREQRIRLKHHANATLLRHLVSDLFTIHPNLATIDRI